MKDQIKKEAIRIGDDLLKRTVKDENGFAWESMSMGGENNIYWTASEGIYSGSGGIILFFIELFKQTNDQKYLEAITEGANWIINYCKENPTEYYAFYTGRLGASYTLLQVYKLTDEDKYLQGALNIAKDSEKFLANKNECDDLLNGLSGSIIGLLHLHQETKEEWLLQIINNYIDKVISRINIGKKGIYWDKSIKQIKGGLCGFSHGVSGIAYVFLELGKYFENEAFFWLAEQAFAYENYYFNNEIGNWPDFRKGIYDNESFEEHKNAFISKNNNFFDRPGYMGAWCHGAPGIGHSRIKAIEFLDNDIYKEDLEKAISFTNLMNSNQESYAKGTYTLCHGYGGNAMLFLESYRATKNKEHLAMAEKVAEMGVAFNKDGNNYVSGFSRADKNEENTCLFMGNAGIGYFYLNVLEPENTPSILSPALSDKNNSEVKNFPLINISVSQLRQKTLAKAFPRTLFVLENLFQNKIHSYFSNKTVVQSDEIHSFSALVNSLKQELPAEKYERLIDLFSLEETILNIDVNTNWAYLTIKNSLSSEKANSLIQNENIESNKIKLNDDVTIIEKKWNWDNENDKQSLLDNFDKPPEELFTVLQVAQTKIIEYHEVPDFTAHVFLAFKESKFISEGIKLVVDAFEVEDENEKLQLNGMILDQIKEGINSLILLPEE